MCVCVCVCVYVGGVDVGASRRQVCVCVCVYVGGVEGKSVCVYVGGVEGKSVCVCVWVCLNMKAMGVRRVPYLARTWSLCMQQLMKERNV